MLCILEDHQSTSSFTSGHVLDTAGVEKLVYEVRWNFSTAPSTLQWDALGANDVSITPDTWIHPDSVSGPQIYIDADTYTIKGTSSATSSGLIVLKNLPRFVRLDTYFAGTTGTVDVYAYGIGR